MAIPDRNAPASSALLPGLRLRRLGLTLAVMMAATASPASDTQAALLLDLKAGGFPGPCMGCGVNGTTYGWSFNVINSIAIDGLGIWDAGANGIGAPTRVGLWTSGGTLLASATIMDSNTHIASTRTDGDWLFNTISAITLEPGSYLLGAVYFSDAPLALANTQRLTDTSISFGAGRMATYNAGFSAPTSSISTTIFGPNMRSVDYVDVAEPGSLALLAACLIGMAFARRVSRA